jgi:ribulose-bisphosphate carboxylase large chain
VRPALHAVYHVRAEARSIAARARALAVEQSVEMPVEAIEDESIRHDIVGRVEAIEEIETNLFAVRIALAAETAGRDPGQLLNILFGNSSLQDDVVLFDAELPPELVHAFGGPRQGLAELRRRAGAPARALTCSALKPQGLAPEKLADIARRFAQGGIDYIKDDHSLAEQDFSPFAARVEAVARALRDVAEQSGRLTRYLPSLSGDLDALRRQIAIARAAGLDGVLIAPMIVGLSNFHTLVCENTDFAFVTHPSLAGASRIAPPLLFGKLFRLFGADGVVFPNHGGRFGYSPATCRALAQAARDESGGLRPAIPVPAGGMTRERVPEMLDFYGADVMLLIGGGLLTARDRLAAATAEFVAEVARYPYLSPDAAGQRNE